MAQFARDSLAAHFEFVDHIAVYRNEQNDRESIVECAAV